MPEAVRHTHTHNGIEIVEFSLLPDHHNDIRRFLQGAIDNKLSPDIHQLGERLPGEMVRELTAVLPESTRPVIYIMRKSPEIEREKLLQNSLTIPRPVIDRFSSFIAKAALLKMHHVPTKSDLFATRKSLEGKLGMKPHKDGYDISVFSTLLNDQEAATRFTNWAAVLHDAAEHPFLRNALVKYKGKDDVPLSRFHKMFPKWVTESAATLEISSHNHDATAVALQGLINKHSRDIILQEGDVAFWTNKGVIIHNGLNGTKMGLPTGEITRITDLHLASPIRV